MSVVSREVFSEIRALASSAKAPGQSYTEAYNTALRGLDAAIILLTQIDHTTKDITIKHTIELNKD